MLVIDETRGDIHVNGNGRDTYKFRAIHPRDYSMADPEINLINKDRLFKALSNSATVKNIEYRNVRVITILI